MRPRNRPIIGPPQPALMSDPNDPHFHFGRHIGRPSATQQNQDDPRARPQDPERHARYLCFRAVRGVAAASGRLLRLPIAAAAIVPLAEPPTAAPGAADSEGVPPLPLAALCRGNGCLTGIGVVEGSRPASPLLFGPPADGATEGEPATITASSAPRTTCYGVSDVRLPSPGATNPPSLHCGLGWCDVEATSLSPTFGTATVDMAVARGAWRVFVLSGLRAGGALDRRVGEMEAALHLSSAGSAWFTR